MIKSLSYEQLNEVESHFIYAQEERIMLQQMASDIAESSSFVLDPTGVHGTDITDTTSYKASKVERETRELRLWGEVVKETFAHFKNDILMLNLLNMLYIERINSENIMSRLYIGKTTLYEYRKEILRYAALKAVSKGLMEV